MYASDIQILLINDVSNKFILAENGEFNNNLFSSAAAKTENELGKFLATKFVPSKGSTAKSIFCPYFVPTFSPINNIGALSSSPSPITI